MNSQGYNSFHFQRHLAATHVRPEHYADFQRLVKTIRHGSHYQLLVAEFNDVSYRNKLIEHVDHIATEANLHSARFDLLSGAYTTFADVEAKLQHLTTLHEVIHILGGEQWFGKDKRWEAFNVRREAIAQTLTSRIVMWLTTDPIGHMALHAPDLWAWRSGVFSFSTTREPTFSVSEIAPAQSFDSRSLPQRTKRIAELRTLLYSDTNIPDDLRLPLLDELASLLGSIGELDEALRIRTELELPVYTRLSAERERALTLLRIAEIRLQRGDHLTGGIQQIVDGLADAFTVAHKLGDPQGIGSIGSLLAQVLALSGRKREALTILDELEATHAKTRDDQGLARIREIRKKIALM